MNLSDSVDDLAPPPPPCFFSRADWVTYLKSAAAAQGPMVEVKLIRNATSSEPEFNFAYPFCQDCSSSHSANMKKVGKCQPDYLIKQGDSTCQDQKTNATSCAFQSLPQSESLAGQRTGRSSGTNLSQPRAEQLRSKQGELWRVFAEWVI